MNLKDPVLQTYVIAASLMCLKMMLQAWMTIYRMIKVNGGFLHPEDIKETPMNPNPSPDQLTPNPDVERSRSMQRNDVEKHSGFSGFGVPVHADPTDALGRANFAVRVCHLSAAARLRLGHRQDP